MQDYYADKLTSYFKKSLQTSSVKMTVSDQISEADRLISKAEQDMDRGRYKEAGDALSKSATALLNTLELADRDYWFRELRAKIREFQRKLAGFSTENADFQAFLKDSCDDMYDWLGSVRRAVGWMKE